MNTEQIDCCESTEYYRIILILANHLPPSPLNNNVTIPIREPTESNRAGVNGGVEVRDNQIRNWPTCRWNSPCPAVDSCDSHRREITSEWLFSFTQSPIQRSINKWPLTRNNPGPQAPDATNNLPIRMIIQDPMNKSYPGIEVESKN